METAIRCSPNAGQRSEAKRLADGRSVDDDACDVLELSTTTEPHGVVGNFHAMRIADPNAPPAPRSFT
jgi:hypothetical protein